MVETYRIAAYTRISVDTELDRDNTSIENQKAIISDFCRAHFPTSSVVFYEDRDHSGYTFEQRPGYMELRPRLLDHTYDILIVKDLSRFSRRTGKGLSEFEDLAESGIRIISIGENVDYPAKKDDWMKIKLYFFVNEMPVTDASDKVSRVIANRQARGEWICSVPYGYVITNSKKMLFEVDEGAAAVVREVFRLYLDGWGYKRIANYLTDQHIPTPRMRERARVEDRGDTYRKPVKEAWSIVTVSEMLVNDFYIGTLRQRKSKRKTINGAQQPLDESEHLVFENHHTPIVDYRTFAEVQQQMKARSTNNYRGVKKYDNMYSGLLFCGDCGEHMFALSRANTKEAYTCGTYHIRGRAGCTSHHIRAEVLDGIVKNYLRKVRDNSAEMIAVLEERIKDEQAETGDCLRAAAEFEDMIEEERAQLKIMMRQKVRDLSRPGANITVLEQTYDAMIEECEHRIEGLENQMKLANDSRNTVIRANRMAKTAIELFDEILAKDKLDRRDLNLLLDRIIVYEDHIEVRLQDDVDALLKTGTADLDALVPPESDVGEKEDDAETAASPEPAMIAVQSAEKHKNKEFFVNEFSVGDPLEIYTDREGEVIFKKYSPIGELAQFAGQYAETLSKTCGLAVVICDRDAVIASAGVPKRDYADRKLTPEVDRIVENRQFYLPTDGESVSVVEGGGPVGCLMPIITEGDIAGCVASIHGEEKTAVAPEIEAKLIQTAASFLGKQLEA